MCNARIGMDQDKQRGCWPFEGTARGKISYSVSSIRAWESGKREPSAKAMLPLAMLFPMPESLQIKGGSFAMRDGTLSVHRDVYTPSALRKREN